MNAVTKNPIALHVIFFIVFFPSQGICVQPNTWTGQVSADCQASDGQDLSIVRYICTQRLKREAARNALTVVDRRTLSSDSGLSEHLEVLSTSTVSLGDITERVLGDQSTPRLSMSASATVDSSVLRSNIALLEENAQLKRHLSSLRNDYAKKSYPSSSLDDLRTTMLTNTFASFYFSPQDLNSLDRIRLNYSHELLTSLTDEFSSIVFANSHVDLSMRSVYRLEREAEFDVSYAIDFDLVKPFLAQHFNIVEIRTPQHAVFIYPRETQLSKSMFLMLKKIRISIRVQFAGAFFDIPLMIQGSQFTKSCGPSPRSDYSGMCFLLSFDSNSPQNQHVSRMRGLDFNNPTMLSYRLQID